MKKLSILFAGIAMLFFAACKNEEPEKPKVIYEKSKKQNAVQVDTTQFEIADLPLHVPGTNVLLHPIGNYRVEGKRKSAYGYEKGSFTISNFSELELTGYLDNIKFQNIATDSIVELTDKLVLIQSASIVLHSTKTKMQFIVYRLADMDSNQDAKLDGNDIQSLYLSTIEGNNFIKISPDLQELVDWNFIETTSRLYFRTIEDTNKNGEFDSNDVLHYHFVDLTNWTVHDYNPVK